jgi:dolichol-phosphate mannosyltransferase
LTDARVRTRISVVVPCFDEEETIPLLREKLQGLLAGLEPRYEVELLFVDDGSTDATRRLLEELAPTLRGRVLVHERNRGIAEAFRTGFRDARGDLVCTIDADCSFDPMALVPMLDRLEVTGADIVAASPYHPEGGVEGVPGWRLVLSRGASWLYGGLLPVKLYSYTACFRVFRRRAIEALEFRDPGFLGVAEMLVSALLAGMTVVEYPMTLRRRVTGVSKMNTLRTVRDHAGFMVRLLGRRLRGAL